MEPDIYINDVVYTENGTESVQLSCGNVSKNAIAIEWLFLQNSKDFERILKFKHIKPDGYPRHFPGYSRDKYDIGKSVNTDLVVKNIDISDIGLFQCITRGANVRYSYTTLLKVMGKSLL